MGRVTMRDVAQVMGVSVMTVSNAFNRPDQLSASLRRDVLARAAKMGYGGPNASARQLRLGRTNAYGVLFPQGIEYAFNDPYSVIWLSGLAAALEPAGAGLVLLPSPGGSVEPVLHAGVDGFVGMCATHPMVRAAAQRGLPIVTSDPIDADGSWVTIDDHQAGRDIADHVRGLGHRRVVMVAEQSAPFDQVLVVQGVDEYGRGLQALQDSGLYPVWDRIRGVLDGLTGLDVSVVAAPGNSRGDGRRAAEVALAGPRRPTAVVCLTDSLALGVLDALQERGLAVADDVSVTGFDDLPDAATAGLTTVHQPIREKGLRAGRLLLDPDLAERQVVLPHRLVTRSSTGRPR